MRFESYELNEYTEVESVKFPEKIYIAYADCGKSCGYRGFIVDGQTQVCDYCGKLMFRTEVKKCKLIHDENE